MVGALLLLFSLCAPAQVEIPVQAVGPGYLVLRANVCRQDVEMDRQFLLDLMCPVALAYYPDEALFLKIRQPTGAKVDLEIGDATLEAVPVTLARIRLLERLTRDHATELKEVPIVGILGLGAFDGHRLEIDPQKNIIRLLPLAVVGDLPQEQPGRTILPVNLDEGPPRCDARLEDQVGGSLYLATGHPHSFIMKEALVDAGVEADPVTRLTVGEAELAGIVPFRPMAADQLLFRVPGPVLGGLGWNFFQNFRITLDTVNSIAVLDRVRTVPFNEMEQAYVLAEAQGVSALEAFLAEHPEGAFAAQGAEKIFRLLVDEDPENGQKILAAGKRWIDFLDKADKARGYLALVKALLDLADMPEETLDVIDKGIEASRAISDRDVAFRLQHQAGRIWIKKTDYRKARLHLLNAVFGLLHEGPVNLDTGLAWKGLNKPNRVWSYFLRALLDVEKTGPEALREFENLKDETAGAGRTGLVRQLMKRLEGRVDAYRPPGDAPPAPHDPPHRPLVEFYTGQACRPCVGVALGLEGAVKHYGKAVTVLSHHLHSPYPDPLVCREGLARAGQFGVRGTPTLFVNGQVVIAEGARKRDAGKIFSRIQETVEELRQDEPVWTLSGTARMDSVAGSISGRVQVKGGDCRVHVWLAERAAVYPGLNEIFIHWYVSRARLTADAGAVPDGNGLVRFDADLDGLWNNLKELLIELEIQLIEQDFYFRWLPSKADPAELVLVVFVTRPGSDVPEESMLIIPEGPALDAEKAAAEEESPSTEQKAKKGR